MTNVYAPSPRRLHMAAFDPSKCAASVWETGRAPHNYQCQRKPALQEDGHGWCKQHAPSTEQAKQSALRTKWESDDRVAKRKRDIEAARARVIETAKAWKHSDGVDPNIDLALDDAVAELERLEAEAQS